VRARPSRANQRKGPSRARHRPRRGTTSPPGVWTRSAPLDARTSLLIFPTGPRSIELIEARVPEELRGARLTAWLHNPGMRPEGLLSPVGSPVTAEL
jgi:hypothetical protein